MAEKKTVPVKKAPSSVKKAQPPVKKARGREKNAPAAAVTGRGRRALPADGGIDEQKINLLPPDMMAGTIKGVTSFMKDFMEVANNRLTAQQRKRKVGPGVRNYGFLEKVADFAEVEPQFAYFFQPVDLRNCIRNIEMCRDLVVSLQAFARAVMNTLLIYSYDAYSMSLIFYKMVKEMSRRGEPVAVELFKELRPFFKRTRRAGAPVTGKRAERDLRALMHGKKDGELIVKNISPKLSGGARGIIDSE